MLVGSQMQLWRQAGQNFNANTEEIGIETVLREQCLGGIFCAIGLAWSFIIMAIGVALLMPACAFHSHCCLWGSMFPGLRPIVNWGKTNARGGEPAGRTCRLGGILMPYF